MEHVLDLAPLIAVLLGLFGLLVWWKWHGERKEEREHAAALAALANALGGEVADPGEARAWSAELLPPLRDETEGFVNRMGTVRRARVETALDFRRGGWSIRVSEASIRKHVATAGATTIHQHRIEVAASVPAPMKISRRTHVDFRGRPLSPEHARAAGPAGEAPLTVAREQRQWLRAGLPEPVNREFTVFTADPAAAARAFTPQAVEWLLDQTGPNPFLSAMPLVLTFEADLVYATAPKRIDPDRLLARVDVVLGLLDRMGATPANPPVTA
ncbi:hypothetical protein [Saccharothrix algeriensis]|uniref:Secreted protein n=1 Tax=Saccharothrix algeriensis TaxID=173560 RepID=A0ABS2SE48_9PSEU|nr:hypothetical protein [Saccharothrix algeriensis]MBM7814542.1 hypothetical protein [Saccharothrix algeriensis]